MEFCWICMQDWGLHSNNTGGFFQCNRYESRVDKDAADNDEGDEDVRVRAMVWY